MSVTSISAVHYLKTNVSHMSFLISSNPMTPEPSGLCRGVFSTLKLIKKYFSTPLISPFPCRNVFVYSLLFETLILLL